MGNRGIQLVGQALRPAQRTEQAKALCSTLENLAPRKESYASGSKRAWKKRRYFGS